jgi:hypothetical protein
LDFGRAKDHGQRLRLACEGDEGDEIGPIEGELVEKTQSADDLIEEAPGDGLGDEVELKIAKLIGSEALRRATEVPCDTRDSGDVGLDGAGCVVATSEFGDEPLS